MVLLMEKIMSYKKNKRKKARKSKSKNIKPKVELELQYYDLCKKFTNKAKKEFLRKKMKKKVKVDDGFSVSHIIRQLSPWKWALLRDF